MGAILETFGINWHLLIAQGINFLILLVVLWWFLYKPLLKLLKDRQEIITKGVNDAERATVMLAGADKESLNKIFAAETEAENILERSINAANNEKIKILKDAETRAVNITKNAEARASEISAVALKNSEKEIARLALLTAEKIMKKQ